MLKAIRDEVSVRIEEMKSDGLVFLPTIEVNPVMGRVESVGGKVVQKDIRCGDLAVFPSSAVFDKVLPGSLVMVRERDLEAVISE